MKLGHLATGLTGAREFSAVLAKFQECQTFAEYALLAMKNFKDATPVTVRLPAELNNRVEIAAERECRSFSGQLRYLIAKALEMQPRKTRPRHDCVGGDNQRSEPGL